MLKKCPARLLKDKSPSPLILTIKKDKMLMKIHALCNKHKLT